MAFRSGFVAIVGLPNAGKSTLLNRLLGVRLSIVSAKPQTTRNKLLGILDRKDGQIVFLDTPGWLEPRYGLQRAMAAQARSAISQDADLVCLLVEPGPPPPELEKLLGIVARSPAPALLAITKNDAAAAADVGAVETFCKARGTFASIHRISAKSGQGVDPLVQAILALLPEQPAFFPEGQLTDRWERFFVAECVREAIFELYGEEIPYATAVEIEQFLESKSKEPDLVRLTVYVERESQKGIIIGKGGRMLRQLTERAEQAAEKMAGRPIRIELWVKVSPNWRNNPESLKRFGY